MNIWLFRGICVLLHVDEKVFVFAQYDAVGVSSPLRPEERGYGCQVHLDDEDPLGGTRLCVHTCTG